MTRTIRTVLLGAAIFVALVLSGIVTRPAQAHAILLWSKPSPNQVVKGDAVAIELRFNSRVDGKRSRLSLVDPSAATHDLAIEQPSPDSIVSSASNLARGPYVLRWQILAQDGHITRGDVAFQAN